jgi:hypothetical protein
MIQDNLLTFNTDFELSKEELSDMSVCIHKRLTFRRIMFDFLHVLCVLHVRLT